MYSISILISIVLNDMDKKTIAISTITPACQWCRRHTVGAIGAVSCPIPFSWARHIFGMFPCLRDSARAASGRRGRDITRGVQGVQVAGGASSRVSNQLVFPFGGHAAFLRGRLLFAASCACHIFGLFLWLCESARAVSARGRRATRRFPVQAFSKANAFSEGSQVF